MNTSEIFICDHGVGDFVCRAYACAITQSFRDAKKKGKKALEVDDDKNTSWS